MDSIDLNCDMGELPEAIHGGTQEALMPSLTSVNIACGGHAGDEESMRITIEQAMRFGIRASGERRGVHARHGGKDRVVLVEQYAALPERIQPRHQRRRDVVGTQTIEHEQQLQVWGLRDAPAASERQQEEDDNEKGTSPA